jgi:phosphatidylserine synthase
LAVPTALTLANLAGGAAGCVVIAGAWRAERSLSPEQAWAVVGLMVAGLLCDAVDGTAARRLGVVTAMGRRLDQVADAVTSALLPGALLAAVMAMHGGAWDAVAGGVFAVAGCVRLARQSDHVGRLGTRFMGLPAPVAGALLVCLTLVHLSVSARYGAAPQVAAMLGMTAIVLSCLMLSRVSYPTAGLVVRWVGVYGLRGTAGRLLAAVAVGGLLSTWGTTAAVGAAGGVLLVSYAAQPVRWPSHPALDRLVPGRLPDELTPARSPD